MRSLKAGEESQVVTRRVTSTLLLELKSHQKQWPSAVMFVLVIYFHDPAVRTSVWFRTNGREEQPELNRKRTRASILLVVQVRWMIEWMAPVNPGS